MSDIPQARDRLEVVISETLDADLANELRAIVALMWRDRPVRKRAPSKSRPVGPFLAERIRKFAKANPNMALHDLAFELGINPGRVSEALHHKR